jgi:hypothetical protein
MTQVGFGLLVASWLVGVPLSIITITGDYDQAPRILVTCAKLQLIAILVIAWSLS